MVTGLVWICNLNGKEFSFHEKIVKEQNIFIYFSKSYHSCKRRDNENTNELARQYFPKGIDFGDITPEQVIHVQKILNFRTKKNSQYDS